MSYSPPACGTSKAPEIPALASAGPYLSRLSARSALFTELGLIMGEKLSAPVDIDYRKLVIEENCLGRASLAARKKLWQELRSRYRLDESYPLFCAFKKEWTSSRSEAEKGLTAYILFALNDRLVADLGTTWLFPLLRQAPAHIRPGDVRAFIESASREHPEVMGWSDQTLQAVAQKYCSSIRDFGLATGKNQKMSVRPALYGAPIRLLIEALNQMQTPPFEIVSSPAFRLLGIDTSEIIDALGTLNGRNELRFRIQGDVIEIELPRAA